MSKYDRTLILPVETQVRELDPKLLFACVAAEQGFTTFIGSQTAIHLKINALPRGIYVAKDIRSSKVRMMRIMHDLGHRIIAWDEEGLVRYPSNHYFKTRVDHEALNRTDMFFAWGREDADTLKAYPGYNGMLVYETGNPRIDLLRREFWPIYETAAAAIRQRYGRYILINTNFGHSNHFLPAQTVKAENGAGDADIREEGDWDTDLARYRDAMFQQFQDVVSKLAKAFPETAIILRPHPAESHDAWIRSAAGCPNVKVIHEGSVVPWIFGADVVVHNGCTTAIEAFLLERPAVTYRPMQSERFDRHLPDSLSHQALDVNALMAEVGRFVEGGSGEVQTAEQRSILERHLSVQRDKLASEQIIDIIDASNYLSAKFSKPSWTSYAKGWMKAEWRARQKRRNGLVAGSKNSMAYEQHRFPGISLDDVSRRISGFAKMLGRFDDVRASYVSDGIFKIDA